jgi:hypothetical protein
MHLGEFMNIIGVLKQEESKLQLQLKAVQGAIVALNGGGKATALPRHTSSVNGAVPKRSMSAAVRARISRAAKARWAKIRAEKAKKTK